MKKPYSVNNGYLDSARLVASPNCDARPVGASIDLLVIHCISLPPGQYGGNEIERFFTNQLDIDEHPYFREIAQLEVSAHLLIPRNAEVVQFVNFRDRAWHAGVSCYKGRERCNDFSIGIELEGCDDAEFTDYQYESLAGITAALMSHFPGLSEASIVGHENIAPGRKTDPGSGFDWQRYRKMLHMELSTNST